MKWDVRVADLASAKRPIRLELSGPSPDEVSNVMQSQDEGGIEARLNAEAAFRLGLDLLHAAARVGVTVRD